VLYRHRPIPMAWKVLPANQPGSWRPHWEALSEALRDAVPKDWTVLVCADRGLYAKRLLARLVQMGRHPFWRIHAQGYHRPAGQATYHRLASVVSEAGTQGCGRVVCFTDNPLDCTLLAHWGTNQSEAWLMVADLPPAGAWAVVCEAGVDREWVCRLEVSGAAVAQGADGGCFACGALMVGVGGGDFVGGRERGGAASGGVWVGAVCWGELFSFGSVAGVGGSGFWGAVCVGGAGRSGLAG
jgi:hypothetical protein